ncbi:TetR/AcrR family transcriptional regulator [Pseudoroseomonas ludipueritiae]|uniref:TetR/AcrR family transcriptional regulator n=2 Tax=Pseudoroseomonas ludipueritiae TaxID=198093 RepID=A0ABR7R522_9PROT|nr:TetR/AcrR family transcriptional regulator [Pseudoroseomonas ludipueritiae]
MNLADPMTDTEPEDTSPRAARLPSAERHAQILDAAMEEFAGRGFAGARMAAVATRAGVTKGLLYHYFPGGKTDLFEAVVTACVEPVLTEARQVAGSFKGSARALLQALIELGYARLEAAPPREQVLMKLLLTEADRFPELARFYRDRVLQPALRLTDSVLEAGVESGEFRVEAVRQPGLAHVLLAPILMGSIWRMMLEARDAPDLPAMREAHLHLALRALEC